MADFSIVDTYAHRYLQALLAGDAVAAHQCITEALGHGLGLAVLYLEVLAPAQVEIGEHWHRGLLNVAQEHVATQITRSQLERLRNTVQPRLSGPRAVVAAVEDESHELGARMVADFLMMDGWSVDFLGANTPTPDLVSYAAERAPAVVFLSVTSVPLLDHARAAVALLKRLPNAPRIVLGGPAAFERPEEAEAVEADAISTDAWDAVQKARALVQTKEKPLSLESILLVLGQRIRQARRGRGWSQQQLGSAAGLDRSYVNAVEQGKQNLTLGAVIKLADALQEPLDRLLFPGGD